MPRMTHFSKISLLVVGVIAILATAALYALFHGYFDHGQFEIKQYQWFSSNQVAMVAERSDNGALGGLEYYVLIGNHLFTPAELRRALYSDAVVFRAANNCLAVRWEGQNRLIVRCNGASVESGQISVQRRQIGSIEVSYENIAIK